MHRTTLELRIKFLGEKHKDSLSSMKSLAAVLKEMGKTQEAQRCMTSACGCWAGGFPIRMERRPQESGQQRTTVGILARGGRIRFGLRATLW